jgi:acetyl esterase/lipase
MLAIRELTVGRAEEASVVRSPSTRWPLGLVAAALVLAACSGGGSSAAPGGSGAGKTASSTTSRAEDAPRREPGCKVVTYTPPTREVALQGDLCVPEHDPTRSAVVIAHGAGADATRARAPSRRTVAAWSDVYTEHGVLSLNIDFTQAVPPGPTYPLPIVDEKNAVQYLRLHARELGIDPGHIIVQGHSGGARMGGNVLVTPDDPYFTAVGTWPGVSDAANGFIGFYGGYRGNIGDAGSYDVFYGGPLTSTDPAVRERLDHANSIAQAADASGPVLLVHGDADTRVPMVASRAFATPLEAAGIDTEVVVVPGGGHGFDIDRATLGLSPAGLDAARRCLTWIEDHFG